MEMFEVRIYDHDDNLLRKSLIQAISREGAYAEAYNVFHSTDGANKFTLE